MPRNLKRYYGRRHLHFITCSCYRRLPLLRSARAKNIFVKILSEVRARYKFTLVGFVIMPEHVHLLIGEPKVGTPSTVMQVLKQSVSRYLRRAARSDRRNSPPSPSAKMGHPPQQLRLRFGTPDSTLPQFWQRRFHDFNVWSHKKKVEKLEYMHMNPVHRKLVAHPQDWPWSSYAAYTGRGARLLSIDFQD